MSTHPTTLTQSFVLACQQAARAVAPWVGKGDKIAADQAATDALRQGLAGAPMAGRVVIGEGERDEAPMLFIGEEIGQGAPHPQIDIAVDPLDGTTPAANGLQGAVCIAAFAPRGQLLYAPDLYMEKLAFGPGLDLPPQALDWSLDQLTAESARQLGKDVNQLRVCALDRPRHEQQLSELAQMGVQLHLIQDGDVLGALLTSLPQLVSSGSGGVDLYLGTGGAPEGVLAAAGLHALGGRMLGRLVVQTQDQRQRLQEMGWEDCEQILAGNQLATANSCLVATAVTDAPMLNAVTPDGATQTLVIDKTGARVV